MKGAYVEDTSNTQWNTVYTLAKIYIDGTKTKILLGVNDTNRREYLITYSGTTASVILKQTVMNNNSVTKFDNETVNHCSPMGEFQLPSTYTCRDDECPDKCKYSDSDQDMSSDPKLYYENNIGDHCYKQKEMTFDVNTGQCTIATYVTCSSPSNDLIHNAD
jgi:hypothetical protein